MQENKKKEFLDYYIPRLINPEIIKEICRMSAEDMAFLFQNAIYAYNSSMFHFEGDNEELYCKHTDIIRKEILNRVQDSILYVLIDKSTNMPFLNDEHLMTIYADKKSAQIGVRHYIDSRRKVKTIEVSPTFLAKFLGESFYCNGAEGFLLIVDNWTVPFDVEDFPTIVKDEVLMTSSDEKQYPFANPEFLRSLTELWQEISWPTYVEGKEARREHFEQELLRTMKTAKFLVPIKSRTRDGKPLNEIPSVKFRRGVSGTPIFTDWKYFNSRFPIHFWDYLEWTVEDLLKAPEELCVINEMNIEFVVSRKMIMQVLTLGNENPEGEQ